MMMSPSRVTGPVPEQMQQLYPSIACQSILQHFFFSHSGPFSQDIALHLGPHCSSMVVVTHYQLDTDVLPWGPTNHLQPSMDFAPFPLSLCSSIRGWWRLNGHPSANSPLWRLGIISAPQSCRYSVVIASHWQFSATNSKYAEERPG